MTEQLPRDQVPRDESSPRTRSSRLTGTTMDEVASPLVGDGYPPGTSPDATGMHPRGRREFNGPGGVDPRLRGDYDNVPSVIPAKAGIHGLRDEGARGRIEATSAGVGPGYERPLKARDHIQDLAPCPHGSFSERERRERGLGPGVTDFSASCNPLGTSSHVLDALSRVQLDRYPDDEATELRRALGAKLGVGSDAIAAGNGSVELLWHLATAFLNPGDAALVIGPTFGEYERACLVAGARVERVLASEADGFSPPLGAAADAIAGSKPRLAFLCNPNNPTGQLVSREAVEALLEACEETLLVVDEAYLPFCESPPDLLPLVNSGRLLLLRSMTKDHGLAGLRLGYSVARPDVTAALQKVRPPWNVNAVAQVAGLAALADEEHVRRGRDVVQEAKEMLVRELSALGLQVVPSAANFLLVRTGDGAGFRSRLLERGVCVRDGASFGQPAHVRIGVRSMPECLRLVEAVEVVLAHG